jgi:3-methylcrotonyl-CoA carboxylase alpha subunit
VLLERYLQHPRHIEFQILGDAHGTIVHLGERDCSIQRRHQKVVEEAPSLALDAELRARMGAAAVSAARSVGYTNAGTVEFLLAADGTFAFLEMNARLQVEHPVTELVYGIDLVHEQLRIANGEPLRLRQGDIQARGWAIEVRLNAEDPAHDYAPQAGTLATFEVPRAPGVRLDSGVRAGSVVPIFYDSMLAKIIVSGADRAGAIARLQTTLGQTRVTGLPTNLPLLRAIAADVTFAAGDTTTGFLEERSVALAAYTKQRSEAALFAAAAALLRSGYGWRAAGIGIPLVLEHDGSRVYVSADRTANGWHVSGDLEGDIPLDGPAGPLAGGDVAIAPPPSAESAHGGATHGSGSVTAPMPGKIVNVAVQTGGSVQARDLLIVLEAMKMEHRIEAPIAGTVTALHVAPGDLVTAGAALATIAGA